jgi:hypothetical protein
VNEPAHHFVYDDIPEYAHLYAAAQWYAWVMDVRRWIAEQYGADDYSITFDPDPRSAKFVTTGDEQAARIIAAAEDAWWVEGRLDEGGERDEDSPAGYAWAHRPYEALAAIIEDREPPSFEEIRQRWLAEHPEYDVLREARRAESEGRLF